MMVTPRPPKVKIRRNYRNSILFLSLPMLGILSAYGVYAFNVLFVPELVAILSCAAFEITVFGLSIAKIDEDDQPYAMGIAIAACLVAILYNAFAGYFHLMPQHKPGIGDETIPAGWIITLALLHAVPIPGMMLAVSWLLLHRSAMSSIREIVVTPTEEPKDVPQPNIQVVQPRRPQFTREAPIAALPNDVDRLRSMLNSPDIPAREKKNIRTKLRRMGIYGGASA